MEFLSQRGNIAQYDELIDFINYVFGFNGKTKDFKTLLPKLYKPEYNPSYSNYIITEDGRIKAAIGSYETKCNVCGIELKCRSIGNVSVHPYSRSKGYMKDCMNHALQDMIDDGIHFSTLGGRRQRYNYFGYDSSGVLYTFTINDDNMRHKLGSDRVSAFDVVEVTQDSNDILDKIFGLISKGVFSELRDRKALYDILKSWQSQVFATFNKAGDFAGYVIKEGDKISETGVVSDEDFLGIITSVYDYTSPGHLSVYVPAFKRSYIEQLYDFAEWMGVSSPMFFNILDYRTVIEAFFRLKSTYIKLPEGNLCLLIHGFAGDEKIKISVDSGEILVKYTEMMPDMELDHIHAMGFLFRPEYFGRDELPAFASKWFPLPLWQYRADEA